MLSITCACPVAGMSPHNSNAGDDENHTKEWDSLHGTYEPYYYMAELTGLIFSG